MKEIKTILILGVALTWFTQEGVHSCSKRGAPVIKPKSIPPLWHGMSSFGRDTNYKCECGNSSVYRENKKFGRNDVYGDTADNQFPWNAYIKITIAEEQDFRKITESDGSYDCSGTLINDRFILTSAECVYQYDPAQNGTTLSEKMNKIAPGQVKVWMNIRDRTKIHSIDVYTVEKIIVHPDFPFKMDSGLGARDTDHDIALLRIKPINFEAEDVISPICIHHSQIGNRINPILDSLEKTVVSVGWVPHLGDLKTLQFNVTDCPREDNPKKHLDLRNYYCRTVRRHEPDSASQFPSMNYGSSLVYHHDHPDKRNIYRVFQYGILSWVLPLVIRHGKFRVRPTKFRLFTNIYRAQILSFIDYHSYKENAIWCSESPDMSVRDVGALKARKKPRGGRTSISSNSSASEETSITEHPHTEESKPKSEQHHTFAFHV